MVSKFAGLDLFCYNLHLHQMIPRHGWSRDYLEAGMKLHSLGCYSALLPLIWAIPCQLALPPGNAEKYTEFISLRCLQEVTQNVHVELELPPNLPESWFGS